ncbi:hypothetical protein SeMB42_g01458 [Synchytrium endobioticum]|uniref:Ribosomal protein n=1 Tax=Synchytrium endobioticum TaxID=286115 RepID=A0A507DNE5_9FUNG|nr:hypothetical protein SeLEV6574_g05582 [Synchytrium endobioticum]TPX52400.1 hypothetical protein SeMB42_g01458 [Synchytrium endobioticum]
MNSIRREQLLRLLNTLLPRRPARIPCPVISRPPLTICQIRHYDKRHYKKQKRALRASRNQENVAFADVMHTFRTYCLGEARPITLHTQLAKPDDASSEKSQRVIHGEVTLPHPIQSGATTASGRILVFARDDAAEKAKQLGAAIVGAEELFPQIQEGLLTFDKVLCMKDMYDLVIREVARYLGPKGLMPTPKKGTVGENLDEMFRTLSLVTKYEADQDNMISVIVGNTSWIDKDVFDNSNSLLQSILQSKPSKTNVSEFIQSIVYSAPRAPGVILPLKPFNLVSESSKKRPSLLAKLGIIV